MKKSNNSSLILIGGYKYDPIYSMENYLQCITLELDRQNIDYDIIRPLAPQFLQLIPHRIAQLFRYFSIYILFPLQLLMSLSKDKQYHIIDHSYSFLALLLRKRCTITCHDLYSFHSEEKLRLWGIIDKHLFFWSVKQMKWAKKIIAVSHYTKQDIITTLKLDPAQIVVSHESVSPTISYTTDIPHDIKDDGLKLIHVGSNVQRKNIELIFHVLRTLEDKDVAVQLIKVGAPFTKKQERLIDSLGIRPSILHKGFLNDKELSAYYSASDILIFPSTFEGFGFPVIEAMACQCAVVALAATSVTELLGEVGISVKENSALVFVEEIMVLIANKTKLEACKKAGKHYVKRFGWSKHVDLLYHSKL